MRTLHTPRLLIWTPSCPCRAARTLYMIQAQMKRLHVIFVTRKAPWRGDYTPLARRVTLTPPSIWADILLEGLETELLGTKNSRTYAPDEVIGRHVVGDSLLSKS